MNLCEHESYGWRPAGQMCSASSQHYVDVMEHFNSIFSWSVVNLFSMPTADVPSRDRTLCLGCLEECAEMAALHSSDGSGHLVCCRCCSEHQANLIELVGFGCSLCRQPIMGCVRIFGRAGCASICRVLTLNFIHIHIHIFTYIYICVYVHL